MNARGLIEWLDDPDPNCEVRIAVQPSWPFEHSLETLVDNDAERDETDEAPVVWLAVGDQAGLPAR